MVHFENGSMNLDEIFRECCHGIGFEVAGGVDEVRSISGSSLFSDGSIVIIGVDPNGAVARDGRLKVGDRILSVNGHSLKNVTHDQALDLFVVAKNTARDRTIRLVVEQVFQGHVQQTEVQVENPFRWPKANRWTPPTVIMEQGESDFDHDNSPLSSDDESVVASPFEQPFSATIMQNLYVMFKNKQMTDCELVFGTRHTKQTYRVHKCVFAACSSVLKTMLTVPDRATNNSSPPVTGPDTSRLEVEGIDFVDATPEGAIPKSTKAANSVMSVCFGSSVSRQSDVVVHRVYLKDIDVNVASHFIDFVYTGHLTESLTLTGYVPLLAASIKYKIPVLKGAVEKQLVEMLDLNNVGELMLVAKRFKCGRLSEQCTNLLIQHVPFVFNSTGWSRLKDHDQSLAIDNLEAMVLRLYELCGKSTEDGLQKSPESSPGNDPDRFRFDASTLPMDLDMKKKHTVESSPVPVLLTREPTPATTPTPAKLVETAVVPDNVMRSAAAKTRPAVPPKPATVYKDYKYPPSPPRFETPVAGQMSQSESSAMAPQETQVSMPMRSASVPGRSMV